ncbi:Uncharacterised protein [Vibrio cholerae]|uniref:hypothetical protein n=1 Tax=Vibrio cholerae TaxID=666 RepID=UPI00115AB06C|nr:hypothetical protein [Vibrio cholerae]TQP20835.1 hypothetical protein FLM00_16990 [Vibrio cholerae]CAB1259799.1 Uncharacterised protein [Vibrio cholerae]
MNNQVSAFFCIVMAFFYIAILFIFSDYIQQMHLDGHAYWFASDPGEYLRLYSIYKELGGLSDNFYRLIIVGVPIIMLQITGGLVFPILAFAIIVFFFSLYSCLKYLRFRSRGLFLFLMLINPVVFLGFFAVNKEIFMISSMLFFLAYYNSLNWRYLLLCFFALFFSRMYILVVYAFVYIVFPPGYKTIRWSFLIFSLISVNFLAPLVLTSGKFGTSSSLLDGAGVGAVYFAEAIRHYLYAIIYFPKYVFLIVMRIQSVLVHGFLGEYKSNLRDFLTSIYSLFIISYSILRVHKVKSYGFKFLMIAIWSPFPLMFSDIVHWRYYIFVLPIFIIYPIMKDSKENHKSHIL